MIRPIGTKMLVAVAGEMVFLFATSPAFAHQAGDDISKFEICAASGCAWGYGLVGSIIGGGILAGLTVWFMRWTVGMQRQQWCLGSFLFTNILGAIERVAMTLIATFDVTSAGQFAVVWMGLKLASNWNRPRRDEVHEDVNDPPRGALSALAGSLVSAGVAIAAAIWICESPK